MNNLKGLIKFFGEKFQKDKECAKKGHIGEKVIMISSYGFKTTANCYCTECDSHYSRRATQGEINDFNKVVNKPFTI